VRLDDSARLGLIWLILGAGGVVVWWAIDTASPQYGYFGAGFVTFVWLCLVVWWFLNWVSRSEAADQALAVRRRQVAYRAAGLDRVDGMSGVEFEHYVAAVFRGLGYQVSTTITTGDFGVDLIASKDGIRTAVQCKRQGSPVGAAAVQQVASGAVMHKCTATMVVCNRSFTRAAQQLAAMHHCRLIDRSELESLALRTSSADRAALAAEAVTLPQPASGSGLLRRPLLAATGVTLVVMAICTGVIVHSVKSQQRAAAAQAAAAASAPCPEPLSRIVERVSTEPLMTIPQLVGLNGTNAELTLKRIGITNESWYSVGPDSREILINGNWTIVSTDPRAGCQIGQSDSLRINVTQ
jgi:Restriction endonuclease